MTNKEIEERGGGNMKEQEHIEKILRHIRLVEDDLKPEVVKHGIRMLLLDSIVYEDRRRGCVFNEWEEDVNLCEHLPLLKGE